MTDSTDDYNVTAEELDMAPLEDDCKLLQSLLDECLRLELGEELFSKIERIRALATCAAQLAKKHDVGASVMLSQRMHHELVNMSLQESLAVARACGHHLNLTGIAEMHHK